LTGETTTHASRKVSYVHLVKFLESMMDHGVNFDDGIRELIDNAVDAEADEIWVLLKKTEGGVWQVIVADNGCGIPLSFHDESGQEVDGIPFVMAFGNRGRTSDPNERTDTIGRFGLGLSLALAAMARKDGQAWVYTRRQDKESGEALDDKWRRCWFNYQDIDENNGYLPDEETIDSPPIVGWDHAGTIVVLDIPNPDRRRLSPARDNLLRHVGRTYRHRLADGLRVRVSTDSTGAPGQMSHRFAEIIDPLWGIPGSKELQRLGPSASVEYPVDDIVFDGEEGREEIRHPITGEHSRISIRMARLRPHIVEKRLFDSFQATGRGALADSRKRNKVLNEFHVGRRQQGFDLLREGREIARSNSFRLYSKAQNKNYFHGEIDFDQGLDELFSVQANKSRYSIDGDLLDLIRGRVEGVFTKLKEDHEKDSALGQGDDGEEPEGPVDRIVRAASPRLPTPGSSHSDEGARIRARNLERAMDQISAEYDEPIEEARKRADEASRKAIECSDEDLAASHRMEAEEAEAEEAALIERREEWFGRVTRIWETRQPVRISKEHLNHGIAFEVRDNGDEAQVVINTSSPFHNDVYSAVDGGGSERKRAALDLMLMAMGYAEFIQLKMDPSLAGFWEDARTDISLRLHQYIEAMREGGDGE